MSWQKFTYTLPNYFVPIIFEENHIAASSFNSFILRKLKRLSGALANISQVSDHQILLFNYLANNQPPLLLCCCFSDKKARSKAPKIQRLVTPVVLQRKRHRLALKRRRSVKKREDAAEYAKILAQRLKEAKERKRSRSNSRSASMSQSQSKS